LKQHNNSGKKSEPTSKRAKTRGPMRRDTKEVLAELVGKLKEKLDPKKAAATSAGEEHERVDLRPNLDRLTVGVDLGDQWSHYCILGLEGETLAEGQVRTRQQDVAEFFQGLNATRVVVEVGTHSAWVREVICGYGHEVLVANPRLMEGSKRRKRKNDRIVFQHQLAVSLMTRVGRAIALDFRRQQLSHENMGACSGYHPEDDLLAYPAQSVGRPRSPRRRGFQEPTITEHHCCSQPAG